MVDATAIFVLRGDDKTQAAIKSAMKGFQNLERGVKKSVSTMNQVMTVLGVGGLVKFTQSVLRAAAAQDKEFANSLASVKEGFANLLSPGDGLPGATSAMQELAATLKDPETIKAANELTSALIDGFAAAAKGVASYVTLVRNGIQGWKVMLGMSGGNAAVDIDSQMRANADRQAAILASSGGREPMAGTGMAKDLAQLRADYAQLQAAYWKAAESATAAGQRARGGWDGRMVTDGSGMKRFEADQALDLFKENAKYLDDLMKADQDEREKDLARRLKDEEEAAEEEKRMLKELNDFSEDLQQRANDLYSDKLQRQIREHDEATRRMSEFSVQAARNMQDAFAQFLFDPFQDGLKGMLKGFVQVIQRMVAEAAAAKIFNSKSEGGLGLAGILGGLLKLPGFASGGSFTVGGQSGTDANLVAFRATRGERVTVSTPGQSSGAVNLYMGDTHIHGANTVTRNEVAMAVESGVTRAVTIVRDMKRRGEV